MRILVTNDDGIDAPGLAALVGRLVATGHEVAVAAPSNERSGSGTSLGAVFDGTPITITDHVLPATPSVRAVSIDAPPGLAVLAACVGALGEAPDAVISGINAGTEHRPVAALLRHGGGRSHRRPTRAQRDGGELWLPA